MSSRGAVAALNALIQVDFASCLAPEEHLLKGELSLKASRLAHLPLLEGPAQGRDT